jgi:Tfp pilus assembly protein PilX
MPENTTINSTYLFTLLGIKEAELTLLKERISRSTQELQQANAKLQELMQKQTTEQDS